MGRNLSVPPPLPSGSTDPFSLITDFLTGSGTITGALTFVRDVVATVEAVFHQVGTTHPAQILSDISGFLQHAQGVWDFGNSGAWDAMTKVTVGTFFSDMLNLGLGVDVSKFDADGAKGADAVDKMVGFALLLQFAVTALNMLPKAVLASRWGETAKDTLAKLPEEMGLSWALGIVINGAFEAALGESLNDQIRMQLRNQFVDWPIVRTGLRQHIFTEAQLTEVLQRRGYSNEMIDGLKKLADSQLGVSDLQSMYLSEVMDAGEVGDYLDRLGFDDKDKGRLISLLIEKADTAAGSVLRSTARTLFRQELYTESDYRSLLTSTNFPVREIEDDIAAVKLEIQYGRLNANVTTIKTRFLHGEIGPQEAASELAVLGYSPAAQSETITAWQLGPTPKPKHLTEAQILRYYVSGVLTTDQARSWLITAGVASDTIDFLLAHPTANGAVSPRRLTPALVTQAFLAGAIQQQDLSGLYTKAGVPADDVQYYIDIALHKLAHRKGGTTGETPLTAAEIREAWKFGLVSQDVALSMLEGLNYSATSAELLLEITNKGVIHPPQQAPFASLQDAINYLLANGYTVTPPPNPLLVAAEQMVAAAGYTYAPIAPFPQPIPLPITGV